MLRQIRPEVYNQMMLRNQQNGMNIGVGGNEIARKAMQNNRNV